MFAAWKKRANKTAASLSGNLGSLKRRRFQPLLERLEVRVTPAFVSASELVNLSIGQGGAECVATGDFNKDGKLDIVATKMDSQFQLYEGKGDGTFQTPISVTYPPGEDGYQIAAGDLNGDGNLDVVTSDQNLGYVYVSLGNGDGTFKTMVHYTGAAGAYRVLIADVDGNGSPDILVSGSYDDKVGVLLNRGDGTFLVGTSVATPHGDDDMTLGHFYGNPGRLDLAVHSGSDTNQIRIYQSNGDGTFQPGQLVASNVDGVGGMTTADVNKDGKDDLLVAASGQVQIYFGNANGTFPKLTTYNAHVPGQNGGQIITADLRHNGRLDVIVANLQTQDISVLLGNDDGTFQPATNYAFNYYTDTLVAADFNGDGKLDVIAGDLYAQDIEFFKGNGNGSLQSSIDYSMSGTEGLGFIASGDLNHDGAPDLISTGSYGNVVDVWIGNGDATYQPPVSIPVGVEPRGLFIADLNKDGNLDIVAANASDTSAHALSILFGNGDGTFKPVQYLAGIAKTYAVTAVDLNGDGNMDLASVCPNNNSLSIYFGNGDGTFKTPVTYSTDSNPNAIVAADFNGDHKPDLLVTAHGGDGGFIDVELNEGNGNLQIPPSAALYVYSPSNAVAADLRNNGVNDVLYADANNIFGNFLGNGDGTFQPDQSQFVHEGPNFVSVGDFDGDGILDAAVCGNRSGDITILKGDGRGDFTPVAVYRNAGPGPASMAAVDLNNDGTLDIAVGVTGSNYITILRNQSTSGVYFLVTAQSTPMGGQPCQFVVTAVNAAGQTLTNYSGTVHFSSNDPNASLPSDMTLTNGVGVVTATFNSIGGDYLRATDAANPKKTGTSFNFAITKAGVIVDHFGFTGAPSSASAGASFNVTVTAYDSSNQVLTGYQGAVHFTSTDLHALLPADFSFTAADQGVHTFSISLATAGTQAVTVAEAGKASVNATQSGIMVQAGALAKLVATPQVSSAQAGTAFNVSLSALDAYGNVIVGYIGTVHFSSSDSKGVLPADYTFTGADLGTHSFSITLKTAGSDSVTVADVANSSVSASWNETITSGAAASLQMSTYPNTTAGVGHAITATLLDTFGNTSVGYTGTLAFSSSDAQAGLPANYTFVSADAGVHTFTVTLKTAGTQSLTVKDAANSINGSQAGITVSAAAASVLLISGLAGSALTGDPLSFTVTAKDAFGNAVTSLGDTVHFASSDAQATLPADYSFTTADHGSHSFAFKLMTTGTQTLTVTDVSSGSVASAQGSVVVNAGPAAKLVLSVPTSTSAGAPLSVVVKAYDAAGNATTNYTGTIHFTSTDPQAVLPPDYTFLAGDQGSKAFGVELKTVGSWSLTATDTVNGALTVSQSNIAVSAGSAATLIATNFPTQVNAGTAANITVTALDAFGNVATGYLDTIYVGSSDPQAVLPSNYTFTSADHGVKTVQVTLKTAGPQTIFIATVETPTITTAHASIMVNVGPTAQLVITMPTGAVAGAPLGLTVKAVDFAGNLTTNYTGTVHFASTDSRAGLPADYTFLASDQGSKTFAGVVLKTAGTESLTVTDVANATLTTSQNNITVSPTSAATLTAGSVPTQITAGVASNITLTARDLYGNIATGYLGTVHFSSTDNQAVLPGNYTFTSADKGVKTVSATLKTAGSQTLTVADVAASPLTVTTSPITIAAASVAKLAFLQQPTTGASGTPMKPAIAVQLFDAFGNLETGDTSMVTLSRGSSASGLTLAGTTSVAAVNGVATFSNLIVNGSGIGLSLQASITGLAPVPSAKFNRVLLSNILPVIVPAQIYGPGPNASAQDAYVKGVYRTLLGRDADGGGLAYWVGQLSGGAARSTLVTSFWNSPENRGREVDAYYQAYLGRKADPGGRTFWVNQLQGGADETAIVLSFLLSAEELSAPNATFVQRLYQGALGRGASDSEVSYWVGQIAQGSTRQQIANSFVYSSEAAGLAVDSFYEAYLLRNSDAAGRAFWVGKISGRSASYASLAITLLESDEFFKNAAANVP